MMNTVETLWPRLQVVLAAFATKLVASDPALRHTLGRTANESFLLRAYLGGQMDVEAALSNWLGTFERFLLSGEQVIGIATARLS